MNTGESNCVAGAIDSGIELFFARYWEMFWMFTYRRHVASAA